MPTPRDPVYLVPGTSLTLAAEVIDQRYIHWYFSPETTATFALSRPLFLHELGHVYDFTTLKNRSRRKLADLFEFDVGYWGLLFTEQFAMAYSFCAMGAYPIDGYWGYGYSPAPWKHQRACALIRADDDPRPPAKSGKQRGAGGQQTTTPASTKPKNCEKKKRGRAAVSAKKKQCKKKKRK